MPRIFISHAHRDAELVDRVATLFRAALGLNDQEDIFCSSREGTGVSPGADVRDEVIKSLNSASALVVLLTPQSVGSPWVWLEAGVRLGVPSRANPLFVVPTERFKTLPNLVLDLRRLSLDQTGELHELVASLAAQLGTEAKPPVAYNRELEEVCATAKRRYSRFNERRLWLAAWVRAHAVLLGLAGIALTALLATRAVADTSAAAEAATAEATIRANEQKSDAVGAFLRWQGQLVSSAAAAPGASLNPGEPCLEAADHGPDEAPISNAMVMAWRSDADRSSSGPNACREPECTSDTTTNDGKFELDLTKIRITRGEQIVLIVQKAAAQLVSCRLNINVNTQGRTTAVANPLQRLMVVPGSSSSSHSGIQ